MQVLASYVSGRWAQGTGGPALRALSFTERVALEGSRPVIAALTKAGSAG